MSKTKVLIIATDFPPRWGGVATYSWELAQTLHRKGFEVRVVTRDQGRLPDAPFKIIPLSLPQRGLLAFPILSLKLITIVDKYRPHHILNTLWLPGAVACFLLKKIKRSAPPYSIVVHAMEIIESEQTIAKKIRKHLSFLKEKTFLNAEKIFCISQFTRQLLLSQVPIDEEKVQVVNNGVNTEAFSKGKTKSHTPTLVTACRLMPHKGIDQVIKSLPEVIKHFPDLRYWILGDGPDLSRLKSLAHKYDLNNYITFKGKVSQKELIESYQQANLYIMLSRQEDHHVEGFGLVFLEAALCGTPSLGGNSGGIPDAITDGKTGWLVEPTDSKAISKKIVDILRDKENLNKVAEQAYQHTLQHRSWDETLSPLAAEIEK